MLHKKAIFISQIKALLGFTLCATVIPLQAIPIYQEDAHTKNKGYGGGDMRKNGELLLMRNFIKPQNIVFDVGANVGSWSIHALQTCPDIKLYAFEPHPQAHEAFKSRLAQFSLNLFPIALSDAIGHVSFVSYVKVHRKNQLDGSSKSGFFHRPIIERGRDRHNHSTIQVQTIPLNDFCAAHQIEQIDFLKIDTEGAELLVLKGAHQLLADNKIKHIQFEYGGTYPDAKITLKEVYELLASYGYSIFRILPNGLLRIPEWHSSLENYQYSNYFAIANEEII